MNALWTRYEHMNALWTLYEHMNTLWTLYEHLMNTWTHYEHLMNTLWTHERFMNTLWTHEHFMNTLWTLYEHIMNALWTLYEHMNALWTRYEHTVINWSTGCRVWGSCWWFVDQFSEFLPSVVGFSSLEISWQRFKTFFKHFSGLLLPVSSGGQSTHPRYLSQSTDSPAQILLLYKWKLLRLIFTWVKVPEYLLLKIFNYSEVHFLFHINTLYCYHGAFTEPRNSLKPLCDTKKHLLTLQHRNAVESTKRTCLSLSFSCFI